MSLLMEHNVPVYKEFCKCLEKNHECILITATGTGKSYIVEEFLQQHNEVALVVVPTKAIAKSWEDLSSNVSVVTYTWFMMHYNELVNQFVYAVFDEAHHIGGDGPWGIAFRNFKSRSTSTYLIGLTADSIRYNDKSKNVAEREFDGHIVYGYDTSEAVEKGNFDTVMIENVPEFLDYSSDTILPELEGKNIRQYLKEFFRTHGYMVNFYQRVDARKYSSTPQQRVRAIVLASRIGEWTLPPMLPKEQWRTLEDAIGDLPSLEAGERGTEKYENDLANQDKLWSNELMLYLGESKEIAKAKNITVQIGKTEQSLANFITFSFENATFDDSSI